MTQFNYQKKQSGFALLITILVLGVVVAVTLGMVELSLKQLKLSVDSTASEIAFYAANAGLECARYVRRIESDALETGRDITVDCFGSSNSVSREGSLGFVTSPLNSTTGQVYRYKHSIDWGGVSSYRCTTIDIITMIATSTISIGSPGINTLRTRINGFESDDKECDAGERCTIMSVVGYSSACTDIATPGVLKREILLEL
jgi:hypothetical protein